MTELPFLQKLHRTQSETQLIRVIWKLVMRVRETQYHLYIMNICPLQKMCNKLLCGKFAITAQELPNPVHCADNSLNYLNSIFFSVSAILTMFGSDLRHSMQHSGHYQYIPVLYDSIQAHSYIDTDKLDHICYQDRMMDICNLCSSLYKLLMCRSVSH